MPRNQVAKTVVLGLLAAASASFAAAEEATILAKLKQSMSHLTVAHVAPSPVAGLYRVEMREKGAVFYITEDASHLVAGDLYALTGSGLANVTEVRRESKRRELLASLALTDRAIPPASCANPVAEQAELAEAMDVEGTPTIITSSGRKIPGYIPPRELLRELGLSPAVIPVVKQ